MDLEDTAFTTFEQFSKTGGKFHLVEKEGQKYIIKEVRTQVLTAHHLPWLYDQLLDYIHLMQKAGISLPEVQDHSLEEGKITFTCKYEGKNIVQLIEGKKQDVLLQEYLPLTNQVLAIIKKAQEHNVWMDPHIKNFVVNNNENKDNNKIASNIFYVDFSPPYGEAYNHQLIENTHREHQEIAAQNLFCFHPKELGFHFAADLLKENSNYLKIMPELYTLLHEEKIITGSFSKFIDHAEKIKQIEVERAEQGIYLI
ncbi:hypothetical protein J4228_00235 [Candidatus Woesearchaeota archaeon]|nr:hypothetical protein [Candidatus Woesearchaeota archaeon]